MTSKAWDAYDIYLFDIDGTLLHCNDAVHYFGFCEVLTTIAGRQLDLSGVTTQGNVDVGILRDALALAQVPEANWRPHLPAMREMLCGFVEEHAAEFRIEVLPGVRRTLKYLQSRGAMLGVASGNLERIGWAKLASCGLASAFLFGGFSDLCETRVEVFAGAVANARHYNPTASICVLGDTPADVAAARVNGLDVIAVATGIYSYDELSATSPDYLVHTLEDLLKLST